MGSGPSSEQKAAAVSQAQWNNTMDGLSKLAGYGLLIDAQRYLSKQKNTGAAIAILRKAEDALRIELWSRHGFGNC
jgi:hypothetical protein